MSTWYINADTGDNGNDGSEESPWETLAYAYDHSDVGDTIVCQDSEATYAFVTDTLASRTIQGEQDDASGAVFDGGGAVAKWSLSGTITFKKIKFQNIDEPPSKYGIFDTTNFGGSGALTFQQCIFTGLTHPSSYGIIGGHTGDPQFPATLTLTNCVFYGNSGRAILGWRQCATGPFTITITGCSFDLDSIDFIFFDLTAAGATVTIKNTILSNYSGGTINFLRDQSAGTISATYCCFYLITGAPSGTGVITSDPLFVDADNGNFNLRQNSPCIDMGTGV